MKIVSPFEYAITQICDPEAAKKMRPETASEKEERIREKIVQFMSRIKTKPK